MIPAVQDQSVTGHVAAALQMSFPQIFLVPREALNWSGETAIAKMRAPHFLRCCFN